jgi:hypothetical protein
MGQITSIQHVCNALTTFQLASHVLPKSLAPLPIGYLRRLLRSICADQDPLSASQRVASKAPKEGGLSWMGPRVATLLRLR